MSTEVTSEAIPQEKKRSRGSGPIIDWLSKPTKGPKLPEGFSKTDEFGRPLTYYEMGTKACWDVRAMWARCTLNKKITQPYSCLKAYFNYEKCRQEFREVNSMK
jgi:hypothetical protein